MMNMPPSGIRALAAVDPSNALTNDAAVLREAGTRIRAAAEAAAATR